MSKDPTGLNGGSGRGEHQTPRDTRRITYDRARTAGKSRDEARKIADQVARDTHSAKD